MSQPKPRWAFVVERSGKSPFCPRRGVEPAGLVCVLIIFDSNHTRFVNSSQQLLQEGHEAARRVHRAEGGPGRIIPP